MPLSDHEQRLLEQIEQALYAEDPKFATSVAARKVRSHPRRKLVLAIVGAIIGLALAASGVFVHWSVIVVGFVLLVASCTFAITVIRGAKTDPDVQQITDAPGAGRGAGPDGLRRRMEDRFRRRFDQ
jgi:hypothetical protein